MDVIYAVVSQDGTVFFEDYTNAEDYRYAIYDINGNNDPNEIDGFAVVQEMTRKDAGNNRIYGLASDAVLSVIG